MTADATPVSDREPTPTANNPEDLAYLWIDLGGSD